MRSFQCVIFMVLHQFCVAKDTLPLFLIDYDRILEELTIDTNPFSRTSNTLFTDIIEHAIKQCSVSLIFVEEQFCTEDVSSKDMHGTPFVNLQRGLRHNKVKYFPNVANPLSLLSLSMPPSQSNSFELKPGHPIQLKDGLPYYYIFLNDAQDETRAQTLRRHDSIIHDVYEETRRISGLALAIYTGRYNPIVLSKTDYGGDIAIENPIYDSAQGVYLASDGALFHFVGLSIEMAELTRRTDFDDVPVVASELRSITATGTEHLRTNIEYQGLEIKFSFRFSNQFWTLDNVTLVDGGEDMGTTILGVNVPIGNSYYCNEPLIIVNENDKSFIRIPMYQIQPFKSARSRRQAEPTEPPAVQPTTAQASPAQPEPEGNVTFSNPVKCNPYFDIPILTGLFVSAICLSILLLGIYHLFNCETNDHYDDPHSNKALVISASDL